MADGEVLDRATFKTMVARMLTSEIGIRNFQANAWSWSSLKRGNVNLTQKIKNATSMTLANSTGRK